MSYYKSLHFLNNNNFDILNIVLNAPLFLVPNVFGCIIAALKEALIHLNNTTILILRLYDIYYYLEFIYNSNYNFNYTPLKNLHPEYLLYVNGKLLFNNCFIITARLLFRYFVTRAQKRFYKA